MSSIFDNFVCNFDFTVGATGDFPTLQAALADESVTNGSTILVQAGTYNITSTINVSKQVKIYGEGIGNTIIETNADSAAPLVMMNVTADNVIVRGITFRHLKTTTNSTESVIVASGGGFPQTRISNFILDTCRLEFMCFGVVTRSTDLKVANNQFVAIGANSGTRRAMGIYGAQGDTFIVGNSAANIASPARALRFINILSTTGTNPNEVNSGRVVVEDNTHSLANGALTQFMIQDNFQGTAGALELIAKRNVFEENNAAIVFFGVSANFGDLYNKVTLQANNITNVHALDGGKGLLGVDGSGAFRSTNLPVHAADNVIGQTVFRTGWTEATGSEGAIVGRSTNITDFTAVLSAVIDASPAVPATSIPCTPVEPTRNLTRVRGEQLRSALNLIGDLNVGGIITGDGSGLFNLPLHVNEFKIVDIETAQTEDLPIELDHTPIANSVRVSVNGVIMAPGADRDFTLSGAIVTMKAGLNLEEGDVVYITYLRANA
jgi:hypothetical protein